MAGENFARSARRRVERTGEGSEDDDEEWAPVVPDMEAGSPYFQTTDPRDGVEKIVMNGLEERKTGEGVMVSSEGERTSVQRTTSMDETSRKGKGKESGGRGEHDIKGRKFGGKGAARTMKSDDEGDERIQVDLEEGEAEEDKKGTRRLRWADYEDDKEEEKGKQEGQEETVEEREERKVREEERLRKQDVD